MNEVLIDFIFTGAVILAVFIMLFYRKVIKFQGLNILIVILLIMQGAFSLINILNWAEITSLSLIFSRYLHLIILISVLAVFFYIIQREIRRSLQSGRKNLRELFYAIDDFLFVFNRKGKILRVNNAVLERLGFGESELIGLPVYGVHSPHSSEDIKKIFDDLISGKLAVVSFNIYDKSGETIAVETKVFSGTWNYRKAYFAVSRDISERLLLEERLRESEKMQAIGQLAGGIAHDFNNQLTGIIGFSEILAKKTKDNLELNSYATKILNIGHRAASITSQLLAFARKGKYITEPVDLHSLIRDVIDFLKYTIDKKITIKSYLDADYSMTLGDVSQLQDCILNIALNARDAMPAGGDLVFRTSLVNLSDKDYDDFTFEMKEGDYILLSITDNGTGIDEDTQKRIFEPFFTTKEPGRGTGMGLAAVYGTVKNHKGTLKFESSPGKGTTFELYFPVEGHEKIVKSDDSSIRKGVECKGTILLIDDEEIIHSVVNSTLEETGVKVISFLNPLEALAYYKDNWEDINLIILDMIMPELGGLETFQELREINPKAIVILASGYSINDEAQKILDQGGMGFLQKPFTMLELMDMITIFIN